MTASTIPPLSVWPCGPPGGHRGAQISIGPSQSPSRSLETAPRGTCLRPGAKVSGSQTDLVTPWYDGRAEIIPFQYLPVLLSGNGTSHAGWDTGDLSSQVKNYGHRTPPGPCCPRRRRRSRSRSRKEEKHNSGFIRIYSYSMIRSRAKAMNEVDAE